ncbi:MAG: DMT family transporter [Alphaproteobacteria bacterium]|nr:DMT family transporter [Alphaproteobacteria bacterium]
MFSYWIPITIFAAFMQNLRSALQKYIKGRLSTGGAAYVRFLYALPLALIYLWALHDYGGYPIPTINGLFLLYCFLGGLTQILFTFILIYLFSLRNFAVGTTFSKTEILQIAFMGLILLGDEISLAGTGAIVLGLVGVVILSMAQSAITWGNLATSLFEKSTLVGLICGAFLGASVVFFRGATLSLDDGEVIIRASFSLAVALVMQTIMMGVYLLVREPGQMTAVIRNWRPASAVGIAGFLGSVGWFTAFTLQNAAYVRAVGQVELIFTFIASIVFFKEKTNAMELVGILVIFAAVIAIILAG